MTPKILYEDDSLLVIDKPSGMVVDKNKTSKTSKEETVEDWLERNFQSRSDKLRLFSIFNFQEMRNGIVHRIDKETSGVLLIAKTLEAFKELQRQFKEREVEKTYVALVHGAVKPTEGVINAPIGRLPWNRERFGVFPGGREAETRYKVIFNFQFSIFKQKEKFSLVEFYPKTGRTHQIRVHAKSINHPVVSDTFYAGRKTSRNDRKWCPRLFLHASKITFTHPITGKRMLVEAPMAEELKLTLQKFEARI